MTESTHRVRGRGLSWRGFWIGWVVSAFTVALVVVGTRMALGLLGWVFVMLLMFGLIGLPGFNLIVLGLLVIPLRPGNVGWRGHVSPWMGHLSGVFFLAQVVALGFMPDFGDVPDPRCESGATYARVFYPAGCAFADTMSNVLVIGGVVLALAALVGLVVVAVRRPLQGHPGDTGGWGHDGPEELPHQDSNLE